MMRRWALLAVAASSVCYGTLAPLGKQLTASGMAITTLLFWRFAIGTAVLAAVARIAGDRPQTRDALLKGAALGCFFAAMSFTYFIALTRAGAAYAVLTLYAYPAVVACEEHTLGNRLNRRRAVTVLLALGGIALLVHPGAGADALGLAAGLASAAFYGTYLVMTSRVLATLPAISGSLSIVATMAVIFGVANAALGGRFSIQPHLVALTVVFGIVSTAVPIALLSYGIPKIGAPRAAVLGTLEPLTAILLVTAFAGERLDALQWLGGALLVASSVVPDRPGAPPLEG